MRKLLLPVVMLFSMASCSLFSSPDTTAAVNAVSHLEEVGINALDTVKTLVENSTGLDVNQKTQLLEKVKEEKVKVLQLSKSLTQLLKEYGDVQWEVVAEELYDLYKKHRDGGK